MKFYIVVIISGFLCTSVQLSPARSSYSTSTKVSDAIIVNQTKRDLSLSYAATDIDSKEGTRIKTITVIKNVGNKKLDIDPELHKNEEWGSTFRDNFDSYGKIPEVPDIDELFDFVNKKPEEKEKEATEAPEMKEVEKPVSEEPDEDKEEPTEAEAEDEAPIEKIKGDAELISNASSSTKSGTTKNGNSKNNNSSSKKQHKSMSRSQSLSRNVEKYRVQEPSIEANSSTQQHFDKYIQEIPNINLGYDYPKPCVQSPPGSIPVTQPTGRTYDTPVNNNNNDGKPYIAPAISKRTQVQVPPQNSQQTAVNSGGPITFPVNSLLPPITPNSGASNTFNTSFQQGQQTNGFSTSQGGYIAPSLRNGLVTSRAPLSLNAYSPGAINYRTNGYGYGIRGVKPNLVRSRGLKY